MRQGEQWGCLEIGLQQVVRRLGRAKFFTAITLLTLAVGVGANTVIFSVVEGVLLKPLAYPDSDRLIGVWHSAPGIGFNDLNMAPFLYFIDREQNKTLEDIGAYTGDSLSITGAGEPEHVRGLDVTSGVLPLLRAKPVLGRVFSRADDTPGRSTDCGYFLWLLGGSIMAEILQRLEACSLPMDCRERWLVFCLRTSSSWTEDDIALYLPFGWDRNKIKLGNFSYESLARLKPGVTIEQASADLARLLPIAIQSFAPPEGFSAKLFTDAKIKMNLKPLKRGGGRGCGQRALGVDGFDRDGLVDRLRECREPSSGEG